MRVRKEDLKLRASLGYKHDRLKKELTLKYVRDVLELAVARLSPWHSSLLLLPLPGGTTRASSLSSQRGWRFTVFSPRKAPPKRCGPLKWQQKYKALKTVFTGQRCGWEQRWFTQESPAKAAWLPVCALGLWSSKWLLAWLIKEIQVTMFLVLLKVIFKVFPRNFKWWQALLFLSYCKYQHFKIRLLHHSLSISRGIYIS